MSELLETLIPAVEEQMTSPATVFVKETFDRLVAERDLDENEAKKMISLCLADESERMIEEERPFDIQRYQVLLDLLPRLPE